MTNGTFILSTITSGLIAGVVAGFVVGAAVTKAHTYKDEQISLLNDQIEELTYIIDHNGHSYDCCCPECLETIDQADTVQNVAFWAVYEHTRKHDLDCECKPCETVNAAMGAKF